MAKKLQYFHINGVVEPIRYILHYSGEPFEDVRHEFEYFVKNLKQNFTYGQLPVYQEGDKSLNQSLAIARYVASKTDLMPSDPWEQAVLDAAALNVYDFWSKGAKLAYEQDPEKKEEIRKQVVEEVVPFFFSRFEKELLAGNGHFNGKLNWADFILVGVLETANLFYEEDFEKEYPAIEALVKKITSLPGVKEYIAARKSYSVPWSKNK